MWEVVLVLGAKMRKVDARALLHQMENNVSAQDVLDQLNEGIIERHYVSGPLFSWVDRKEGCCQKHGVQSFLVNDNSDAFCPQCLVEMVQPSTPPQHEDKHD